MTKLKLSELEAARAAMTSGTWQPGVLRTAYRDSPARIERYADAQGAISAAEPFESVISGCGCCGSPDAKVADVDGICTIVNAAPTLIRIAKAALALAWRDCKGPWAECDQALLDTLEGVEL